MQTQTSIGPRCSVCQEIEFEVKSVRCNAQAAISVCVACITQLRRKRCIRCEKHFPFINFEPNLAAEPKICCKCWSK